MLKTDDNISAFIQVYLENVNTKKSKDIIELLEEQELLTSKNTTQEFYSVIKWINIQADKNGYEPLPPLPNSRSIDFDVGNWGLNKLKTSKTSKRK